MTSKLTGELRVQGEESSFSGTWTLAGETLEWELEGKNYCIQSNDDLSRNIASFLKALGKNVLHERVSLQGCMTCKNFAMSEMARDMGRGQRGVCEVHQKGVEVCYVCSDYVSKKEG